MAVVRLRLLGCLEVRNAKDELIDLRVKKVMALLAYLAVQSETTFSRAQISKLFWPSKQNKQSRHSLRQALADLRKHLPDFEHVFNVSHNEIHITPGSIAVDVSDFSEAAKIQNISLQKRAYQLYQGQFLDGFKIRSDAFNTWCEETSALLFQRYIQVIEFVAEHSLLEGDTRKAIELNNKLIQLDPIRESAYRCLMSISAREGLLDDVEKQYQQCCKMLQKTLDTVPEERTTQRYQRIMQQTADIESTNTDSTIKLISPFFTGRDEELLSVASLLKNYKKDKKGHCVLVTGESAVGKSWLLQQCVEIAEKAELHTASSRFFDVKDSHENGIRDLLSEIAKPEHSFSNNEIPEIIAQRFFNDSAKREIYLAILYIIYDLPIPKQLQSKYSALNPVSRELLHTRVIVDILSRAASEGELVLIFDDIHLAMPRAFSILSSLLKLTATHDLFLIFSSKHDTPFTAIDKGARITSVALDKLSASDLEKIFPLKSANTSTDMNFLNWAMCLEKRGITDYVDNIESVIKHCINELSINDQVALQASAILGMRFSQEALKSLIDNPHFKAENLIAAGFLTYKKQILEFTHQQTQQCIYQQIDKKVQKDLHLRAASYYMFGNNHLYACHLEAIGSKDTTKAYISAGIAARDEYRLDFATYFFEKAFACANNKQDKYFSSMQKGEMLLDSDRISNAIQSFEIAQHLTNDKNQQAQAWLGMAIGLIQRKQFIAAKGLLERSESILAKKSEQNITAHKTLARYYYHRALTALHTDTVEAALRFHKIAFEHAKQCQSSYWQANISMQIGNIELENLRLSSAYDHLEFAVRTAREHNHGHIELQALLSLARVKLLQADFTSSVSDLEHVMHLATLVEDHSIMLDVLSVLCISNFYKGQFNRLRQHTGLAMELCENTDATLKVNHIVNYRLLAFYHLGRQEDIKQQVLQSKSQLISQLDGQPQSQSWNLAPILALIEGQADDAAHYLDYTTKGIEKLNGPDRLECCFIAIEAAIKHKLWAHADNLAHAIILQLHSESLPFFLMCAERVRILSRIGQRNISHTTRAELVDILTSAKQYGLAIHLPEYESALEALRHGTETV